jgi:hypothetical protein
MKVLDAMGMEDTDDRGMEGAGDGVAEAPAIGFRFGTFASDTGVMGSRFCCGATAVGMSTVEMLRPREWPVVPIVETDETGEVDRYSL